MTTGIHTLEVSTLNQDPTLSGPYPLCPVDNSKLVEQEFLSMGPGYSEFESGESEWVCPICQRHYHISHEMSCVLANLDEEQAKEVTTV